jgi:hypothetical protein
MKWPPSQTPSSTKDDASFAAVGVGTSGFSRECGEEGRELRAVAIEYARSMPHRLESVEKRHNRSNEVHSASARAA